MANQDLEKRNPEPEVDQAIWKDLPQELVDKCLGHLPVLTIAFKLREVNKAWRDYPGTQQFMKFHNHDKNLNACFGFLMYERNTATNRCETMTFNHEAMKWQTAPSLQLHGRYSACKTESVSEGLILLSLSSATSRSFIVWNPLLRCKQAVPGISQAYRAVNLVVDTTGRFKIVAFSVSFRECLTYSPTTSSWQSVNYEAPIVHNGLFFPQQRGFGGGYIAIAYKSCVYVAVVSFRNDVYEVGDLCYDVERNVWKPAVLFRVSPARVGLYDYCFTTALFVVNDVIYKVVEYQASFDRMGNDCPHPTLQILARSLAPANNAGAWAVLASTVFPHSNWETNWVGSWYACTIGGHEKPTICGLFYKNYEEPLYMMMYDVGKSTWNKVCVTNAANNLQCANEDDGFVDARTLRFEIECKWKAMRMVFHYTPSWICPAAKCTHHHSPCHGRAHVEVV